MTPLQEARLKRRLSQHKLAKLAKVDQTVISRVETGAVKATRVFAEKVCSQLPGLTETEVLYPERFMPETTEAA